MGKFSVSERNALSILIAPLSPVCALLAPYAQPLLVLVIFLRQLRCAPQQTRVIAQQQMEIQLELQERTMRLQLQLQMVVHKTVSLQRKVQLALEKVSSTMKTNPVLFHPDSDQALEHSQLSRVSRNGPSTLHMGRAQRLAPSIPLSVSRFHVGYSSHFNIVSFPAVCGDTIAGVMSVSCLVFFPFFSVFWLIGSSLSSFFFSLLCVCVGLGLGGFRNVARY